MFALPWYSIILISIPQTILIILLGFQLFNQQIDFRKCLLIALLGGVITYTLRRIPIAAGGHTILLIIFITILVSIINKSKFLHNLSSIMLGSMILGTIEGVWCPLFLRLTYHSIEDIVVYPWLNITCFIPILIVTVIIYIVIRKRNYVIYDLNSKDI